MKTILLTSITIWFTSIACYAQQWEYMKHDTSQTALNFILPTDDGGHFGLNNFGNQYTVLRYDANDDIVWSQYVECQDDLWISSFLLGSDGNIYVEGEQYQTCYFVTDTLSGHNHFIAKYDATNGDETLHIMPQRHRIVKMFVNDAGDFTLFTAFGNSFGEDFTLINGDTIRAKGGTDGLVMTMNTSFSVLDTLRIYGTGITSISHPSMNAGKYHFLASSYNSGIRWPGDSLAQHATYSSAHFVVDANLNVESAEYLKVDPQGASITDYHFMNHATYFIMRQSSWGDVIFENSTLASDGNNKLWLIKLNAAGDLESSKLISSTGNQYVFGNMIYAPNDTIYVLGESNQDFDLDQGSFETDQYKSNMFVFLADTNFNTVLYTTIDDTTGGQSAINNPRLIDGDIYACGWFNDTVKVNGETFEDDSYSAWWGKLSIAGIEDTVASIDSRENRELKLFPNPASTEVTLQSRSGDIHAIEFYDLTGKLIKVVNTPMANLITVNISDLNNGIYLINTVGDRSDKLEKLVVSK